MELDRSSYRKNNFGEIIYRTVLAFPPAVVVELGVLDGFSSRAIAQALYRLNSGHLYSYDLWEDYPFNHGSREEVESDFIKAGLSNFVTFHKEDAYAVHKGFSNSSVDILHVDISNEGSIFNFIIEAWTKKIKHCGLLLFEGGSKERDEVEWMIKYSKLPIRPEMAKNKMFNENYIYGTYNKFPSLTIARKVAE